MTAIIVQSFVSAPPATVWAALFSHPALVLDGRIAKPGVYAPEECVPAAAYVEELAKRGIVIEESAL